jgi:hypothetical protein
MLPLLGNCQTKKSIIDFKPRSLKPHDYYVKDQMSFFIFDYYQTRYLLEQKKIKDLYNQRLLLTDTLITQKDTIIKNYKSIVLLKQQQLDSTNKKIQYYNNIINVQRSIITENKHKIRNKNVIIITLIGTIGSTFFLIF